MGKFSNLLKNIREMEGKTSKDDDHYHEYEVNEEGNGKTVKTIGSVSEHVHKIDEFDVQESNGHSHDIPEKKPKIHEQD